MFGFSGEHLLVLLVILLIFGPKRLPDLGHSLGRTLKNFKDAVGGNHDAFTTANQQIAAKPAPAAPIVTREPEAAPQITPEEKVESKQV